MLIHRSGRFDMNVESVANVLPNQTLFIHGNLASNRWWQPSFEILKTQGRKKGYQGTAWLAEWRGCGKSSRNLSAEDLNMNLLAEQYVELIEDLTNNSNDKFDLVGHSTGGLIALIALQRAPHLFRRAVLLDPVAPKGFQLSDEMLQAFEAMRQDRSQCEMVMAATIHNVKKDSSLFQSIVDDAFAVDPKVWTGVPQALQTTSFMDKLNQIQHPILVMHGEVDPILPKEDSQALAKALAQGTYLEVQGHGHSLNVEDPVQFVDRMEKFFAIS